MLLKEAFSELKPDDMICRVSSPQYGAYYVLWLMQLMDYKYRTDKPIGSMLAHFLSEDAIADDWELTTDYYVMGMPDFKHEG